MDMYFAGAQCPEAEDTIKELCGNRLMSFVNDKKLIENWIDYKRQHPECTSKIFVDSGAFTAWTQGKDVDVDTYIDYINTRSEFLDLYGQVDCIPGDIKHGATSEQVQEAAQKTWENYLYMRPKMDKPEGLLYTFHVGEPYLFLEKALEWKDEKGNPIPYIALGGMVRKPMPTKRAFLDTCFRIIKKSSNPNVKTHAFGMTSFDSLEQYPITSADSTSWIMTGANGNIMTDVGIIAVSANMSKLPTHYTHLPKGMQETFEKTIKEFGFTLDELSKCYKKRIMLNVKYMHKKASQIQYKPKPKTKPLF